MDISEIRMNLGEFRLPFSEPENPSKSIEIDFLDTYIDLKFTKNFILN